MHRETLILANWATNKLVKRDVFQDYEEVMDNRANKSLVKRDIHGGGWPSHRRWRLTMVAAAFDDG